MSMRNIFFLVLCCIPWRLCAQEKNLETTYFSAYLQGTKAEEPVRQIKLKHIDNERRTVWQAWVEANHNLTGDKLPPIQPLDQSTAGHWELPPSLEPNAILPFYYGCKGERPVTGWPFYLYLHGSGPKAREWATGLRLAQVFADSPSVYFIPQIPNEGPWYRWWQRSKQFAWNRLLRNLLLNPEINPNRLYVFGISEGGYGSQRLASFYADYWAAAGPMAGGEPLKNAPAENLGNIAFSLRTGADDKGFYRDVLTHYTQQALDSLSLAYPTQYKHRVELIPGYGHHIDYRPTTPWLSAFERNPWPKTFIWEDFEMDGMHRTGFYNLQVERRPDSLLRTRYEFHVENNEVTLRVQNVNYLVVQRDSVYGIDMKFQRIYTDATGGKLCIYLDEHLVDLSKPVSVNVNGNFVYAGKVKPDVRYMLRSVATFYDPERIYPVAVEVEY